MINVEADGGKNGSMVNTDKGETRESEMRPLMPRHKKKDERY